jgi:hypothetical protein
MASPGDIYQQIQGLFNQTSSSQQAKLEFVMGMADLAYENFKAGKVNESQAEAELASQLENMRRRAGLPTAEEGVIEEALRSLRKRINEHPATVAFLEAKAKGSEPSAAQKKAYDKLEDLWQEAVVTRSDLALRRIDFQQAKSDIGKMADKIGKIASPKQSSREKQAKDYISTIASKDSKAFASAWYKYVTGNAPKPVNTSYGVKHSVAGTIRNHFRTLGFTEPEAPAKKASARKPSPKKASKASPKAPSDRMPKGVAAIKAALREAGATHSDLGNVDEHEDDTYIDYVALDEWWEKKGKRLTDAAILRAADYWEYGGPDARRVSRYLRRRQHAAAQARIRTKPSPKGMMTREALERVWRDSESRGKSEGTKPVDFTKWLSWRPWEIHLGAGGRIDYRGVDLDAEVEAEVEQGQDFDLLSLAEAAPLLRGDELLWVHVYDSDDPREIVDTETVDLRKYPYAKTPTPKKASARKPSPKKASARKPSPKKASARKPSPKRPSARPKAWAPPPPYPAKRVTAVQFDGEAAYPYYDELEGPFEIQMGGAPGRHSGNAAMFHVAPIAGSIADQLIARLKSHDIAYEPIDASDEYVYLVTAAPESYDDGSTVTLGSAALETGDEGRVVAVLRSNLDWQEKRYQSGMYPYSQYTGKAPAKKASPKKASPKKPSPRKGKPSKNLTYAYAKSIYEKIASGELEAYQFPNIRVISQLGDIWLEADGGELLDGPFKTRQAAQSHRSKALEKAQKAVEKQTSKAKKAAKKVSPKKASPAGPTAPYHGARDEQIVEFDNERVLWRVPTPGSTTVWWMITDYDGRMLPDTVGYKTLRAAMNDWKVPAPPPKRLTPSEKPPVVEGVPPKVGKVNLRGVGPYDAIPAAYLRPGDVTVWNEGITALVLDTEPAGAFVKVKVEEDTASGGIKALTRRLGRDSLVAVTGEAERRVAALAEAVAVRPSARKRQSGMASLTHRPLARHLVQQFNNALAPLFEGFYFRVYEDRSEGGVGVGVEAAQAPPGTTKQKALKSPVAVGLYITGYPKAGKKWIVGEPAPPEVQAYVRTVHAPRYMLPLLRFGHHEGLPQAMASDMINYFRRNALRIKSDLPIIEMGQEMKYMEGFALKHPSIQRCLGPREIQRMLEGDYPDEFVRALVPRLARLAHRNKDMKVEVLQQAILDAADEAGGMFVDEDEVIDNLNTVNMVQPTHGRGNVDWRRFVCTDLDPKKPPTGGDLGEHVEWALELSNADPSLAPSLIEAFEKLRDKEPHRMIEDESEFYEAIRDWAYELSDDHWIPDEDDLWQALRKALVVFEVPHSPESRKVGEYAPSGYYIPENSRPRTPQGALEFLADERFAWENDKVPEGIDDYPFERSGYLRAIGHAEKAFGAAKKRSSKRPSKKASSKRPSKKAPSKRPSKKAPSKRPSKKAPSKRRSGNMDKELLAMCVMTTRKAFARPEGFRANDLGEYNARSPIIRSLVQKGFAKVARNGTITPNRARMKAEMRKHPMPKHKRGGFFCNSYDFLPETPKPSSRKPSPKKRSSKPKVSVAHSVTATSGGIAAADQLAADLAMVAWQRMMTAPGTYYVYLTPSTATRWGSLHVVADAEDPPSGSEILTPERIPGHKDLGGITAWLRPMIRRAPVIPSGTKKPSGRKASPKKRTPQEIATVVSLGDFKEVKRQLDLLEANPPRIRREGKLHVVEIFSPFALEYIPQGEHLSARKASKDLDDARGAQRESERLLRDKLRAHTSRYGTPPSAKKPSAKKPSAKKPSAKKASEATLNIMDAGAFAKLAKMEGKAWEAAQKAGGAKLANSFALNKAAYETIIEQGLQGLDIPLSELDPEAGVIAGKKVGTRAAYIVMPDGEIMLDSASVSKAKAAKAAKYMQVI